MEFLEAEISEALIGRNQTTNSMFMYKQHVNVQEMAADVRFTMSSFWPAARGGGQNELKGAGVASGFCTASPGFTCAIVTMETEQ